MDEFKRMEVDDFEMLGAEVVVISDPQPVPHGEPSARQAPSVHKLIINNPPHAPPAEATARQAPSMRNQSLPVKGKGGHSDQGPVTWKPVVVIVIPETKKASVEGPICEEILMLSCSKAYTMLEKLTKASLQTR
uniref:Uncharacterized protein n=1 Tax=Sphaerodactylus townsendi TaxID=933632 RepID=A0ACB8FNM6_9SAUR